VLFILSPMIGELLSGSAPPVEFFNPLGLLVLLLLYGGGAVLIREWLHRWDKGWWSLLLLGAAYGMVEEGLMVKSFFDPNWMDLGILGSYGRWAGVNWVWSLELTLYHMVFSIAIPIALVRLVFPDQVDRPWVGKWTFRLLLLLFVADIAFGYLALTPYRPPVGPFVLTLVLVLVLFALARSWPHRREPQTGRAVPQPWRFWLMGLLATVGFFAASWVLPNAGVPVWLTMALMLAVFVLPALWVRRMSGKGREWQARHLCALAAGALSFLILIAPIQESDATRLDDTRGMTLVGLGFALFLGLLYWRVRRRSEPLAW
jgi:hypothetical protein